jgi:hypothetical protein
MNKQSEPDRVGTQGWRSFLASKQQMLHEYRLAQKYSKSHTVQTHHGNVAEAIFRKWLKQFLPKRYAVTSGYVISQGNKDSKKMPHFDVIIYDQLESPILWHEGNPDKSETGVSRAIPAEYVVGILEVKSSLDPKTVLNGMKKLRELEELMVDVDNIKETYKKFLPANFCCALVFFELRKENSKKYKCLENMLSGSDLRGNFGAMILEGETLDVDKTGRIMFLQGDQIPTPPKARRDLLSNTYYGKTDPEVDGSYFGVSINWNEINFPSFVFDLLAVWNGTYRMGFRSSGHGMSRINPKRKRDK